MPNVIQLPRLPVPPQEIPEPQRSLLVHQRDMTSTLAAHHDHEILLDVIEMMQGFRELIREGRKPLGWILEQSNIPYLCDPHTYFKVEPDEKLRELLGCKDEAPTDLYGRINRISNQDGELIADVVEILP